MIVVSNTSPIFILINRVGFWIDEQLYTEVLQAVDELP